MREGGPLAAPDVGAGALGPAAVGEPLSYGLLSGENPGDDGAVLDRVELIRPTPGLQVVGSWAEENAAIGLLAGYPPRRHRVGHPVAGYGVAPHAQFQIVIGIRAPRSGRFAFHGLRLAYHVGSKRYSTEYELTGAVCAPRARWTGRCRAPED